jgi:pilus assembly protein CpaC
VGTLNGGFNTNVIDTMTTVPPGGGSASFPVPFGNTSLDIELRALETRGAVRTLAEPVLTAMSGQPATFLAGGELPYDTFDDNGHRITAFKPYGVQLAFTPTINSNGTIQLLVKSTVSEPNGLALNTRDVSTTVELGVGQTLSIGGMLSESSRQAINKFPGLGDIPILGALFRSREYTSHRTELIFLVTPYYARAKNEMPVLPTDELQFAGDAEAIFLGHIETIYGVGPGGLRGTYDGSVGFLLD